MIALPRPSSAPVSRRGVISLWTASVLAFCGFSAFIVISIWLDSGRLLHARHATESAALAAAHAWLSDDLLRANQASFETEARMIRCREAAEQALDGYRNASAPLQMATMGPECIWKSGITVDTAHGQVPVSVRISVPDAVPATSPGLAKLFTGQALYAASTAAIENQPAAICPGPDCSVPFLPFAAVEDVGGAWTQLIDNQTGADAWSWNPQTRRFEVGPDGIPEITVNLSTDNSSDSEPSLVPLKLLAQPPANVSLPTHAEIIRSGLTRQCLDGLGLVELRYPSEFPGTTLSIQEISQCLAAFESDPAEPRILSLASALPASNPVTSATPTDPASPTDPAIPADPSIPTDPTIPKNLTATEPSAVNMASLTTLPLLRPVAVRVASLTLTSASSARVTFQPCVLVSSVIRSDLQAPHSRCVYSVRLIE